MLFTGIPLFRSVPEILHCLEQRVIPSGRSSIHSSSHSDNVPYRPDARQTKVSSVRMTWITVRTFLCIVKLLFLLASVRMSQQPVRMTLSDRASDFLSKIKYGKIASTVRTMWIPVRTHSPVTQESQFKLNRLDVSLPWSGRTLNRYGNCV
jgi:hypothetical protein